MRVQGLRDSLGGANSHLHVLASDLEQGAPAIHDEMMRLEAVRDVCKTTGKRLYQTVEAGRKRVEELSNREEPDVDGMICATSIVGNQ